MSKIALLFAMLVFYADDHGLQRQRAGTRSTGS